MVNGFLSLCAHKANERNEAAARVGEYAAVEGVFAKLLTSKAGNTFLNIGAAISTRHSPAGGRNTVRKALRNNLLN
jgi:hypothetical protein